MQLKKPEDQSEYDKKVKTYEDEKNQSGGLRIARSSPGKQPKEDRSVEGRRSDYLQFRKCIGNVWDTKVWS